ncbi:pyruvate ferredoxin oxidoreductase [Patescibacteria group bacterium]|nr:pyruvate ferredoxin oxidoreductase [Patescibacteria group bacterium]
MPFNYLINPGHSACAGCGEILAMRHVLQIAGRNTIIANATGCSEVTTSRFPMSSFKVPWIHANFENAQAVASGISAALRQKGMEDQVNVIAWGGDGATFDIGLGLISGSWERQENILYVCFDNEAYMNTGIQASGATPEGANTTTTPPGKKSTGDDNLKKDMPAIALAHHCVYVATATVGNIIDLQEKVKKALSMKGPKYLQILVTCVPGWYTDSKDTIKVARLAQQTGIYPIIEYVNGELTGAAKCPRPKPPIEEYLKLQGRYKHLFKSDEGKKVVAALQRIAEENVRKYGL